MRPRRTPLLLDVLLALMLTGLSIGTLATQGRDQVGWPGTVLAVLAVAPLAMRQVAPVLTLLVIVVALGSYALLGYGDPPSASIGMVVAMFSVATLRPRWVAAATYPTTLAAVLLTYSSVDGVTWTMVAQAALICLCAWALGEATRRWAQQAEAAAAAAERSAAEERARIARELHDVVAHHMSVVALQTGVAGYLLDADPPAARTAVEHAASAGREALQDMGRMLGALRTDEGHAAPYAPQPGLHDLGALLARMRSARLDVRLDADGELPRLAPGPDLCAYRVVQESLTNVLRHAGPGATARVSVSCGERVLEVTVVDDGGARPSGRAEQPVPPPPPGTGHGIRGMRERAELYGGVLDAGRTAGGGFAVHLRLPVQPPLDREAPSCAAPAGAGDAR